MGGTVNQFQEMHKIPVRRITSPPKDKENSGSFSIREVQALIQGKHLVHELHRHDFYFLLAIHKGQGMHEIDFNPYNVHDNSVFILRPGQVHQLELKAGSSGFLMEFNQGFYKPKTPGALHRWEKAKAKNYCPVKAEDFLKLNTLLLNILHEFTVRQEGFVEAIIANLDLFFIEYARQSLDSNTIASTNNDYAQDRFEKLVHLLEVNIGTIKNVSQYADRLNLSSYQLNAITKSAVGKTVSVLINEQIVLEAKRHLLTTNSQVKDIADHLGYEDVSYFIRFFKKHAGHTPDAFRKNFK